MSPTQLKAHILETEERQMEGVACWGVRAFDLSQASSQLFHFVGLPEFKLHTALMGTG